MGRLGSYRGILAGMGAALLVFAACTAKPEQVTPPSRAFVAAPRVCPSAPQRANLIRSQSDATRLMGKHLPTWFPSGFGLAGVWGDSHGTWAIWEDRTCRMVTVSVNGSGSVNGSWKLEYDVPLQCGNEVMGMGECIGYSVGTDTSGSLVGVQTIGLTRHEAELLVHSIPL